MNEIEKQEIEDAVCKWAMPKIKEQVEKMTMNHASSFEPMPIIEEGDILCTMIFRNPGAMDCSPEEAVKQVLLSVSGYAKLLHITAKQIS